MTWLDLEISAYRFLGYYWTRWLAVSDLLHPQRKRDDCWSTNERLNKNSCREAPLSSGYSEAPRTSWLLSLPRRLEIDMIEYWESNLSRNFSSFSISRYTLAPFIMLLAPSIKSRDFNEQQIRRGGNLQEAKQMIIDKEASRDAVSNRNIVTRKTPM